jgi:hypothetical protein
MPARSRRLALLIVLMVAALSGCRETMSVPAVPIAVTVAQEGIVVSNLTAFTMYYMAVEPGFLATANMAPRDCEQPGQCPSIPPHGQIVVPWSKVSGFDVRRTEYLVYWSLAGRPETGSVTVDSSGVTPEP